MNIVYRISALVFALASTSALACPDYLNNEMRRLSSKETINFCEDYAGKAMLIVNTASNCGYTPQFDGLEALHREYQDKGLVVIGFSSDDFFQEENDEGDVATVCYEKYDVSFPMMATSGVRGKDANPVFRGLGEAKGYPTWNFNKYVVDTEGNVVEHFGSNVGPDSQKLRGTINAALAAAD
ncbi:MAG: glutathione peroxidase [Luminiphilus sp.]|nr:glutathione peroxidase [Luminiphilus sp.]